MDKSSEPTSMSLCDRPMIERAVWKRLLLIDAAWFGMAGALALVCGTLGDQIFRKTPLGLRYQTPTHRMLSTPAALAEPINSIGIEEVDTLLSSSKVILIDARPRVFYEMGHLPGARSLSREQFDKDFAALEGHLGAQGQALLIYCSDADCEDGAIVARTLQQRGLGPLQLFHGGFAEWEAAGKPVETSQ
jgi:rhodanese-related sulfurtransferase